MSAPPDPRVPTLGPPRLGLPQLGLPRVCAAAADRLRRQQPRRDITAIAGRPLYLQRLGASVLAHEPTTEGWLCTLIATSRRDRPLPTGVCTVPELDLITAVEVDDPCYPLAHLDAAAYLDVWLVRASQHRCGGQFAGGLAGALVNVADLDTLQIDGGAATERRLISQTRLRPSGLRNGYRHLCNAGYLVALTTDPDEHRPRYAFAIPPSTWPH